jgi:lipopolysaccharide assembly protein B
MDTAQLWVFLFLALLLGFFLGSANKRKPSPKDNPSSSDVKHRLQLLFDSYSDEAIDRFISSLEVSKQTLSTHISIGAHFRKQGEVEKAILIHQNLMAHPEISNEDSESVIFELAKDYKQAGLFDRAESLLSQLSSSKKYAFRSVSLLLDISEREKDWRSAIELAEGIDMRRHPDVKIRLSQYYCQLAEEMTLVNSYREARQLYRQALSKHKLCVRALIGEAEIELSEAKYDEAIRALRQAAEISPEHIVLILPMLLECTIQTQSYEQHQAYLKMLYSETGQIPVLLALVSSMEAEGCGEAALEYLVNELGKLPSLEALNYLFAMDEMSLDISPELGNQVVEIVRRESKKRPAFRCVNCGFSGSQMHWSCPSCKSWQSIKPVLEYEKNTSN